MDSDLGNLSTPENTGTESKGLSAFEGHEVSFARVRLTSTADLEVGDRELQLDSVYRFFIEGKVVGVNYIADRDGKLVRAQTVKVTDSQLLDWDDPETWGQ